MNVACRLGITPLLYSSNKGDFNSVDLLIKSGAAVNERDKFDNTSLLKAAKNDRVKCLELLIKEGGYVNSCDKNGTTPVMATAERGYVNCLEMLLKAGADVNTRDKVNNTALNKAAVSGRDKCVKMLIKEGADVNSANDYHITPLVSSIQKNRDKCTDSLLEAAADVNTVDIYGRTALIYAAKNGRDEYVEVLIHMGADVNTASRYGNTALMCAAENDPDLSILSISQTEGADVKRNAMALERTSVNYSDLGLPVTALRLLLQAGAHVNIRDKDGRNALKRHIVRNGYKSESRRHSQRLLLAAGETIDGSSLRGPQHLKLKEPKGICLMVKCRAEIRRYLLEISPVNLLVRVPKLGLPPALAAYLLYDMSLQ